MMFIVTTAGAMIMVAMLDMIMATDGGQTGHPA